MGIVKVKRQSVVRAVAGRELREHLVGARFRLISCTTLILVALSTSNSLTRGQALLGKYLGGMTALALALVASILTALVAWLLSGVPLPRDAWPRIGLWLGAILLYLSAMFWIGLLVSVLTRRA